MYSCIGSPVTHRISLQMFEKHHDCIQLILSLNLAYLVVHSQISFGNKVRISLKKIRLKKLFIERLSLNGLTAQNV